MDSAFERAKALFVAGIDAFESARYAEADSHFEASLQLLPGRISTLNNLAATRIRLMKPESALALVDDVLGREPGNLEALAHRGSALSLLERHAEALACYERVLAADPERVPVMLQRATTLGLLDRDEEAVAAFDAMLALAPDNATAWLRRGQNLLRLARHDDALASVRRALDLDPTLAEAWTNRGTILAELKRTDEAAEAFERAIAHGGDPQLNGFFLAGIRHGATPAAPPRFYVETLFDDYAKTFDEHLVHVLHYRAHDILVERLKTLGPRRFTRALDLGCGTGLCGVLLQPIAAAIDGIDLSANMLEKAAERKIYAELVRADIGEHLDATDRTYDLVVAADVFIYVGDLSPIFTGVRRVLEAGGRFCFSAEMNEGADFALQPTLRYAHSEPYLRLLAQRNGFAIDQIDRRPVREDQHQPIPGLFVYLTKREV